MAYRLPLDDVKGSLAHAAEAQIKRLRRAAAQDDATFQQRRALKRLRALLQLAVTAKNRAAMARLDRLLRDAGRHLSDGRDRTVVGTSLERLSNDGDVSPSLERALRRCLVPNDVQARLPTELPAFMVDEIAEAIATLRLRRVTVASVIDAAADGFRAARRGRKPAVEAGTSEAFHDWRKVVQRHARHMQLLVELWPEDMAVRTAVAKDLARALGDEHDLHGFGVWLATVAVPKSQTRAVAALGRALKRRQRQLRETAVHLGRRAFVERPKAFRRRLNVYARQHVATKSDATGRGTLVVPDRFSYSKTRVENAT